MGFRDCGWDGRGLFLVFDVSMYNFPSNVIQNFKRLRLKFEIKIIISSQIDQSAKLLGRRLNLFLPGGGIYIANRVAFLAKGKCLHNLALKEKEKKTCILIKNPPPPFLSD